MSAPGDAELPQDVRLFVGLFRLGPGFDLPLLRSRRDELIRFYHPDRTRDPGERERNQKMSTYVNEGYERLRVWLRDGK